VDADNTKNQVIDLDLKGLPASAMAEDLKKLANVKHVITAVIDHDSITNACTGTGRVKLRLGPTRPRHRQAAVFEGRLRCAGPPRQPKEEDCLHLGDDLDKQESKKATRMPS